MSSRYIGLIAGAALAVTTSVAAQSVSMSPATMPRIGTVDARYQSYNVEALEVTGGKFWKPYGPEFDAILKHPAPASEASSGDTPASACATPQASGHRCRPDASSTTRERSADASRRPWHSWRPGGCLPHRNRAP